MARRKLNRRKHASHDTLVQRAARLRGERRSLKAIAKQYQH